MVRKKWMTLFVALACLVTFATIITAQQTTPQNSNANQSTIQIQPQIQPMTAVITQQVPVSLILRLPLGPAGVQTITVPVLLNVNIQVGLAQPVSRALSVSLIAVQRSTVNPSAVSVVTPAPTTPIPTATRAASTPTPVATTSPLTGTPTVTTTVLATSTRPAVVAAQCPVPSAAITSPGVNQVVSGTVNIRGTATHENFDYYKLEYAVGANANQAVAEYRYFAGAHTPVTNNLLGVFESRNLPNRAYTLRLTVVDKTGNFPPPCQVTVLVQNP